MLDNHGLVLVVFMGNLRLMLLLMTIPMAHMTDMMCRLTYVMYWLTNLMTTVMHNLMSAVMSTVTLNMAVTRRSVMAVHLTSVV